jgi:hypothetical protein
MNYDKSSLTENFGKYKLKLAWVIVLLSISEIAIGQSSKEQYLQAKYVTALEDSLIILQAIRPAFYNLQVLSNFQNLEIQSERNNSKVKIDECEKSKADLKKDNRKKFWSGFKTGVITASLITTTLIGAICIF